MFGSTEVDALQVCNFYSKIVGNYGKTKKSGVACYGNFLQHVLQLNVCAYVEIYQLLPFFAGYQGR